MAIIPLSLEGEGWGEGDYPDNAITLLGLLLPHKTTAAMLQLETPPLRARRARR